MKETQIKPLCKLYLRLATPFHRLTHSYVYKPTMGNRIDAFHKFSVHQAIILSTDHIWEQLFRTLVRNCVYKQDEKLLMGS